MNITWIHNLSVKHHAGGAEFSDYYWINKLAQKGHRVKEVTMGGQIGKADLYILGNFDCFPLGDIAKLKPFYTVIHGEPHGGAAFKVYEKAEGLIFMSPSHAEKHKDLAPGVPRYYCAPYVDYSLFIDEETSRRPSSYLYVGNILNHKGISLMLDLIKSGVVKGKEFSFYGWSDDPVLQNSIRALGGDVGPSVDQDQVVRLMNTYEYFFWHLGRYGSYGRTLVEAMLCGMKLEVNKGKFGLFSYDWDFSNRSSIIDGLESNYNKFIDIING